MKHKHQRGRKIKIKKDSNLRKGNRNKLLEDSQQPFFHCRNFFDLPRFKKKKKKTIGAFSIENYLSIKLSLSPQLFLNVEKKDLVAGKDFSDCPKSLERWSCTQKNADWWKTLALFGV